jgi:glucokinase
MAEQRYLVCDIGGTNIRVAAFDTDPRQRIAEVNYRENTDTREPWDVLEALADYRGRLGGTLAAACLGVAGRVRDDGEWVAVTNRPNVTVRRKQVAEALQLDPLRVRLVNDMPPHIACVDSLEPRELHTIKAGEVDPGSTRAIVMPGTGLGVGGAVYVAGHGYEPFPSEGGHLDFAPRSDPQDRLLRSGRMLARELGHHNVSNEFFVSGPGLRRIFACLAKPDAPTLGSAPPSEQITALAGKQNGDPQDLRRRTIDTFIELLGQVCGNVVLMELATGGLFVGGGICRTLRAELASPTFREAFCASGPPAHRSLLEEVPVRLIDYAESGLLGAGVLAKQAAKANPLRVG